MFNKIEYLFMRSRFIQLACLYTLAILLYRFTTIPHSRWIFSTVVVLLAANNPGIMYQNSYLRGIGTIYGVILFIPLVYLFQINYKLIPFMLFIFAICHDSCPPKRHDIMVMFMTIIVFMLNSFTDVKSSVMEGPISTVIKRLVCVLIAICLCIVGDYIFFKKYNYSQKLYAFYQRKICSILSNQLRNILHANCHEVNKSILVGKMRNNMNQIFLNFTSSSDGLFSDRNTGNEIKDKILLFDKLIWQIRKLLFAVYQAKYVIKNDNKLSQYTAEFSTLMKEAHQYFIKIAK